MRDTSMFNFLLKEAPTQSVDLELIAEFAKEAASAFLSPDKIPLNQTITKIAQSNSLSPEHINLVCQEANKEVHTQMFNSAEDKYITFDIADPVSIVSGLEGSEKVASVKEIDEDYMSAPGEVVSYYNDFSVTKTAGHCGLSDISKKKKQATIEKTAARRQELQGELMILDAQIESLEKQFVKTARNHICAYPIWERASQLPYVAKFCKEAGMAKERIDHLMGYVSTVMVKQGLIEKTADLKADPELISENLNARIINGNHPLEVTVKTLIDKDRKKAIVEKEVNQPVQTSLDSYNAMGSVLGQDVKEL